MMAFSFYYDKYDKQVHKRINFLATSAAETVISAV